MRRNNTIMALAGVLLFRPTQLKLDGILTCTAVHVQLYVPVQLVASANFYMLKVLP